MGLKKKRAQIIGVVSTLAVASLVSVGFANWVILETKTDNQNATITVDSTVTAGFKKFAFKSSGQDQTIKFAGPTSDEKGLVTPAKVWLEQTGDESDYVAQLIWEYELNDPTNYKVEVTSLTITDYNTSTKPYEALANTGHLAALPTTSSPETVPTDDSATYLYAVVDATDGTVTVNVKLAWGLLFGNKNPYVFYNDGNHPSDGTNSANSNKKWSEDAQQRIGELSTLNGEKLTVHISAKTVKK